MDIKRFFDPEVDFTDLSSVAPTLFSFNGSGPNSSANSINSGCTGVNPFPYIGDPLPPIQPSTVTIGTATGTYYPFPNTIPSTNIFQTYPLHPLGALGDFFNIQYLSVEAMCAVTGKAIKPGEPVLVLDEHIISKAAFMKMLREKFESMMFREEEMHEITGYDS